MIRGMAVFLSDAETINIAAPELEGDGTYYELNPDADDTITHKEFIRILARLCIYGAFGNGETRKAILGLIYDEVQKEVNYLYEVDAVNDER